MRFLLRLSPASIGYWLFLLAALAVAILIVDGGRAFAQAASPTTIDASPLLQIVWPLIGGIATALAGWVAQRAATWLHLQNQDVVRGYVLAALNTGIDMARARLDGAPLTIETRSQTVASIANYLITAVPQGLKALGITPMPDDPKLLALVAAKVEAEGLRAVQAGITEFGAMLGGTAPPGPAQR